MMDDDLFDLEIRWHRRKGINLKTGWGCIVFFIVAIATTVLVVISIAR